MSSEIVDALRVLQGLPMQGAHRAVTLLSASFGEMREIVYRGKTITRADYALHVECPWCIVAHEMIVVGFADRLYPGNDHDKNRDFEWMDSTDTRWDRRMQQFMERTDPSARTVRAIRVGAVGGFTLAFGEDIALEVFPDTSVDREIWRLLTPDTTGVDGTVTRGPHIVAQIEDGRVRLEVVP